MTGEVGDYGLYPFFCGRMYVFEDLLIGQGRLNQKSYPIFYFQKARSETFIVSDILKDEVVMSGLDHFVVVIC